MHSPTSDGRVIKKNTAWWRWSDGLRWEKMMKLSCWLETNTDQVHNLGKWKLFKTSYVHTGRVYILVVPTAILDPAPCSVLLLLPLLLHPTPGHAPRFHNGSSLNYSNIKIKNFIILFVLYVQYYLWCPLRQLCGVSQWRWIVIIANKFLHVRLQRLTVSEIVERIGVRNPCSDPILTLRL